MLILLSSGCISSHENVIDDVGTTVKCEEANPITVTYDSSELKFIALENNGIFCGYKERGCYSWNEEEIIDNCILHINARIEMDSNVHHNLIFSMGNDLYLLSDGYETICSENEECLNIFGQVQIKQFLIKTPPSDRQDGKVKVCAFFEKGDKFKLIYGGAVFLLIDEEIELYDFCTEAYGNDVIRIFVKVVFSPERIDDTLYIKIKDEKQEHYGGNPEPIHCINYSVRAFEICPDPRPHIVYEKGECPVDTINMTMKTQIEGEDAWLCCNNYGPCAWSDKKMI